MFQKNVCCCDCFADFFHSKQIWVEALLSFDLQALMEGMIRVNHSFMFLNMVGVAFNCSSLTSLLC